MNRQFYQDLAKTDNRIAFGADLIIRSPGILHDGEKLGECIVEAGRKYSDPLGLPYIDLKVEKEYLLNLLEVPQEKIEKFRFATPVDADLFQKVKERTGERATSRMEANCGALTYLKDNSMLVPIGMTTGPFSLMTKLLEDPNSRVFKASLGICPEEDPDVRDVEILLETCTNVIRSYIEMQIDAGAEAIMICEPAASIAYISPDTLRDGEEDIFDRYVIQNNRFLKEFMDDLDVDLILHDCGELSDTMIKKLCKLDPVILSLGSSVDLPKAAALVPDDVILFGNLPSRQFFPDDVLPADKLEEMASRLEKEMKKTGHPFILGSAGCRGI